MSLSIIVGSSGSGKSTYAYKKIINEAIANKKGSFLCIVPEQYTMSTQRLLVEMHPNHCIMNIDVLSFNRLAYRVFDELGASDLDVLDDTGKSLVLRKLVEDHLDELFALKKNMTRISYIAQVKSLISELTQYNNTPEQLRAMIDCEKMSQSFKLKAKDLLVLYEAFLDYTRDRFLTTESILTRLDELMEDSKLVAGSTVVLDGFTGFTPIQYDLVEHLLKICDEVIVTMTADDLKSIAEKRGEEYLFAMTNEFYEKMVFLAKRAGVEINEPVFVDGTLGRLASCPPLMHLEKNIFRDRPQNYTSPDATDSIELYSLKNPRQELDMVAKEISKLVRGGMRYKDIAIVCPNLESYRYIANDVFKEYDIPFFIDAKTEILFTPFVEAIKATFEILDNDFSKDAVFRFLRTGLSPLSRTEIDVFENYIISTGIRGKGKYLHPFAVRSNSYSTDDDMVRVNEIREKFIGPFSNLITAVGKKDTTASSIADAFKVFLEELDCKTKLEARKELQESLKNNVKAKEYEQIYDVVMDLLDKMKSILSDEAMDVKEFSDIFDAGMSAATIGLIPPEADSVIIGDIERTRLNDIKVLYCVGASDDAIPKKVENGGILSQLERELLLESGFTLAPTDRDKAFRQRFYLYLMLTKPSRKLVITTPRVGGDGKAVRISYLIDLIKGIFTEVKLNQIEEFSGSDKLLTKGNSYDYLIELLQKSAKQQSPLTSDERSDLELLLAWAKREEKIDPVGLIDSVFYAYTGEKVSKEVMLAVNEAFNEDETVSGSISKFEAYSNCAYRYFLTYILKLKEREEFELSAIDMGDFYHDALDRYGKALLEDGIKWHEITDDQKDTYIDIAIKKTAEHMPKVKTLEDPTGRYIVDTMKDTLRFTVDILTEQIKRGSFEPLAFEEGFKTTLKDYENGENIAVLKGSIDRVDITEERADENSLMGRGVRIIDYKLSDHKLKADACYYGLSLQLPIYMDVILEKLKDRYKNVKLNPSALLYYTTENPFIEDKEKRDMSLFEKRLLESKMDGLLSSDPLDLRENDGTVGMDGNQKSLIVPYEIKTDGSPAKKDNNVSREYMDTLINYAAYKASEISKDIIDGKFEPSPARLGAKFACTYCKFKPICHFDENKDGFEIRELEAMKPDTAIPKMAEELRKINSEGENSDGAN